MIMRKKLSAFLAMSIIAASLMAGCGANEAKSRDTGTTTAQESVQETETNTEINTETEESDESDSNYLSIAEQGIFSAGGSVIESDGTFDVSNYYTSREGSTSHVDHANVFYQIPENDTELPMVFLHGYGQSRMAWMTTPDGREGWSDMFLKKGHSVFLIDQPRRGEAGQTSVAGTISTEPSDQTWYTQFRIGTYVDKQFTYNENSQFPQGEETLEQFFRQMTPDTAMDSANGDQNIDTAIVAIEPGMAAAVDSEDYNALLEKKIPVVFYYGDYIGEEFADVPAAGMWSMMSASADAFSAAYNEAGASSTVVRLPEEGIYGNDHMMFQDLNNDVIADHIQSWIDENLEK